ncbi:MAG TPA: LysR substrate-binding domain-containing protein [Methylomirabilota bacterium]|nr:LysR substrate-binding domain-containing protein [Methylomirabilota bacterium]
MELRHVRSFIAVAEAGSFAAAAARLRVSQPALWRQVRTLEDELGMRLFDRVGRRVRLTGQGEELVIRGRELLAHSQAFAEQARAFGAGDAGVLRLGGTPQILESLASFLARWRRALPGVSLQLVEDGGSHLYDRLDAGDVQLAITVAGDPRFHYRLLRPARLLAIVPARHRLAAKRMVEVSDLVREPLLLLRQDFGSRGWFDAACRILHARPDILLESGAPGTLLALARAGHGVAVIPSTVVFARSGLRALPVAHRGTALGRWLGVCWDPRRYRPRYVDRFVEDVTADARRTGERDIPGVPPVPKPAPLDARALSPGPAPSA